MSLFLDILATASRDGSIRIWDRRIPGTESGPRRGPQATTEQPIATVNHIKNAHGTKGKPSKGVSDGVMLSSTTLADVIPLSSLLALRFLSQNHLEVVFCSEECDFFSLFTPARYALGVFGFLQWVSSNPETSDS